MNQFKSDATSMTPEIVFSPQSNSLSIVGECYPENPIAFFAPVFSVLKKHFQSQEVPDFEAVIRLRYVNSASTKALRYLFVLLDDLGGRGSGVQIRWQFDPEDDALQELGADLAEDMAYLTFQECPVEDAAA